MLKNFKSATDDSRRYSLSKVMRSVVTANRIIAITAIMSVSKTNGYISIELISTSRVIKILPSGIDAEQLHRRE